MIERIDHNWPHEPSTEGYPEDFVQTVLDRRLPFDEEDPLVFHVLTTLGDFEEGETGLLRIMQDGGSLLPRSWADRRWGDEKSMIFARDKVAGDDEWLFTTPCNVFSDYHDKSKYRPAVCFRLSTVRKYAKQLAFRVHDLEPQYRAAEDMFEGMSHDFYDDEDEAPPDWEEVVAEEAVEQIKLLADFGTQWLKTDAIRLVMLYAKLCGAFRGERYGRVAMDDPDRVAIFEDSLQLLPDTVRQYVREEADVQMWVEENFMERPVEALVDDWGRLFARPSDTVVFGFPHILLNAPSMERPELLIQGELPLCEAAFYRDASQAWKPVGKTICKNGLSAFRKRRR